MLIVFINLLNNFKLVKHIFGFAEKNWFWVSGLCKINSDLKWVEYKVIRFE